MAELTQAVTGTVDSRFQLFASACEEIGAGVSSYTLHRLRMPGAPPKDYEAFIHDNPMSRQLQGRRLRVSHLRSMVTMNEWSLTDHYNGVARPSGFNDMMTIVAQSRPTTVLISMFGDSVFSGMQRWMAGILQPHIAAALKRVHAITTANGPGPLHAVLSSSLRPLELSLPVRLALRSYFPNWQKNEPLPAGVRSWLAHSQAELRRAPDTRPLRPLAVESYRGRLLFRCFPEEPMGLVHLIMVEVQAVPSFLRLRKAGFTLRECELMHWVARERPTPRSRASSAFPARPSASTWSTCSPNWTPPTESRR